MKSIKSPRPIFVVSPIKHSVRKTAPWPAWKPKRQKQKHLNRPKESRNEQDKTFPLRSYVLADECAGAQRCCPKGKTCSSKSPTTGSYPFICPSHFMAESSYTAVAPI